MPLRVSCCWLKPPSCVFFLVSFNLDQSPLLVQFMVHHIWSVWLRKWGRSMFWGQLWKRAVVLCLVRGAAHLCLGGGNGNLHPLWVLALGQRTGGRIRDSSEP